MKLNTKKTNWKQISDMVNFVKNENISVNFIDMNHFAFSEGNSISINKNLPSDAKIYMLAHEIGHYLEGTNNVEHFSLELETADLFAINALELIDGDVNESFEFIKLYKYPYFKKVEEYFEKQNKKQQ